MKKANEKPMKQKNLIAGWAPLAAVSLAVCLLTSCATLSKKQMMNIFNEKKRVDILSRSHDAYLLGSDDVVRITVDQHPEWSGDFKIGPTGKIIMSGLGDISAAGLTKTSFEQKIVLSLSNYINEPKVTVDITKYSSEFVYVLGEVNSPGRISTEGKLLTLRDAVVSAGLPTHFAAESTVYVITPATGKPRKQVINLYRILYQGELGNNIELSPGDIVYVPKNWLGKLNYILEVLLSPISAGKTGVSAATTPL